MATYSNERFGMLRLCGGRRRLSLIVLAMGFAALCNPFDARAQGAGASIPDVRAELLEDIAAGSRILAELGVLDGFR
jgi:hypothetical protein